MMEGFAFVSDIASKNMTNKISYWNFQTKEKKDIYRE